jgi:hypothetical protein
LLFAYSRLELSFGLHLIWFGNGKHLEDLATEYGTEMTSKRIGFIKEKVAEKYVSGSDAAQAYESFFRDFDGIRKIRNDLVHGRWGHSDDGAMTCVVGIPTSPAERSKAYTVEALDIVIQAVSGITARHEALRKTWPV